MADHMHDVDDGAVGAATVIASRRRRGGIRNLATVVPWFLYVIFGFVVLKLAVGNVREVILTVGPYALSWVEVLYVTAAFVAMSELLRVSQPGVDNTWEAMAMLTIAVVQMIVFALGAAQVLALEMFHNTEFLVITLISVAQSVLAIKINARTLKRTIDYGGGHD